MRRFIVRAVCLPADLPGFALAWLVLVATYLAGRFAAGNIAEGCLVATSGLQPGRWRGLTLGHAVVLWRDATWETMEHELRHVRQWELGCLTGAALAIVAGVAGAAWWALVPLLLTGWVYYGAGAALAWSRGEDAYRDNDLEREARR